MEPDTITANKILEFWFSEAAQKFWFKSTTAFDNEIQLKFESVWQQASTHKLDHWKHTAEGALALIIILDQFPLNMFRGTANSFATEKKAIELTHYSISNKYDLQFTDKKLAFLYLPLMHSENINDQKLCVSLLEKTDLDDNLRFAKHHLKIIQKFGRFPHRNYILNRISTSEEINYLSSPNAFKG